MSAADLLASMKAALDSIPREPFAELMDREGMPPEDGYILILPARFRDPRVPRYVRFADVPAAYIVKDITGAAR